MAPGEPVSSTSDDGEEEMTEKEKLRQQRKFYQPDFAHSDWFCEPLINFNGDTASISLVSMAVRYWTDIAFELKSIGYPIAEGIDNYTKFPAETIRKARMLDDFLNVLCSDEVFTNPQRIDALRVMLAQSKPYLKFKEEMARVDFSLKCNTIWENDAVAFRCNTCALTPCMSLCEACFEANGHAGHDYIRFFSREGGACDCGNQDVIRELGNCPNHGDETKRPKYDMKEVVMAEYVVTKCLVRLFLDYRGWVVRKEKAFVLAHGFADPAFRHPHNFDIGEFTEKDSAKANRIIEFLQECSNYGGPMRLIVAEVLLNKDLYKSLTEKTDSGRVELSLDWRTTHKFREDRASALPPEDFGFHLSGSIEATECYTLLDELIFWIIRQIFPQNLVNFGLSFLSEPGYRDAFADRFFSWYPLCGKVISELCDSQSSVGRHEDRVSPACSRAVHVTVQMLSSASLCKTLNETVQLVRTIFDVSRFLICQKLVDSEISLKSVNIFKESGRLLDMVTLDGRQKRKVMTPSRNSAVSQHGYWFVMGDIQNVLTHTNLAVDSVLNDDCFGGSYMKMMCQMQGMNPIWRVISGNAHEHDQGEEVQKAYTLQFETLAVTLFNIVAAIQEEENTDAAIKFVYHVKRQLEEWFHDLLPVTDESRDEVWGSVLRAQAYAVSFHIPLHRHISTALTHFTELPGFSEYVQKHLIQDEPFLRILLVHPLRIQVAKAEINCSMWVRNGAQARMSALIYSQWNVATAFQTPDVDLIRFCAANIDKEHFVKALTSSFNVTECIKIRRGKFSEKSPEARELFAGKGAGASWPVVPECLKVDYENYRKMIRERALLIENMMLPPEPSIFQFEPVLQDEVSDLMAPENNTTEVTIDYQINLSSSRGDPPPRIPIIREFIRRHLMQAGVDVIVDDDLNMDREFDPSLFDNSDVERTTVIREPEWIDPMFWGMFKLIAELVVVRVNSGASSEEHYRSEMVNCMAMGNQPYSRLRASISEKGSRGSELIDKYFAAILKEIGDFIEPNESSTHLQQGSYQLKTSVWDSEVCPVFFMMRSSSIKQAREVFAKMEKREMKNATESTADTTKIEERFWVPFRLIDFSENKRHPGISSVYNILLTERLLIYCVTVLATENDQIAKFHEYTVQLAVYLLTLAVKYAESFEGSSFRNSDAGDPIKKQMIDVFHTPFNVSKFGELDTYYTICGFIIRALTHEARKTDRAIHVFRNILSGEYDKEKVTGGKLIYLARFVTILCKLSPVARIIIEGKLKQEEHRENQLNSMTSTNESRTSPSLDPAKKAAKEAAKRRMEAIMQNSAKKSAQAMQKLMKTEGMSAAEVSKEDPSQQNRKKYECPICGEQETPNTVENPFGMLAKLSTNFVCEEQIDATYDYIENLLEYDDFEGDESISMHKETRRHFSNKRRMVLRENEAQPEFAKVRAPLVGTDLKTCGHTAHIECFNAYRASLYDHQQRSTDRREVGCPLCRYTVNVIIPMTFDKPYAPIKTPPSPISYSDVWKIMEAVMTKAKVSVFQEDEKNVKYFTNYSTREGGGLSELYIGRQFSADWTERQSSLDKCTVSTLMVSIAVAMVERSSMMRRLGVPERRKNGRNSLTEHIMTASVATSKDVDFDVALSAMSNLFAKVTESTLARRSPRPKSTKESSPRKSEEKVAGLTAEEITLLGKKTPQKVDNKIDTKEYRMKVPLFALEPKSTLVRMLALLINNQSVTQEIQREMAQNMIRASVGWVSSHTLMCLVLRLGRKKMEALSNGELKIAALAENLQEEAESIAKALTYNQKYFEELVQKLVKPEEEPTDDDVHKTVERCIIDFLRFSSELLLHCNLGCIDITNYIHDPNIGLNESLVIMGIDPKELNLPGKANYWTLMYRHNLMWMVNSRKLLQPFILEPLAWKVRKILRPPKNFEDLFTRYFHRECERCSKSPSNPLVCLFCGELLCLDDCCRVNHQDFGGDRVISMSEIESHAEGCSSSSGLFISIISSMVIVSRGKQAAIWGTIYLDAHKEEDRNLKRGKPLYLCETRLKWLEYDWVEQEWQRVFQWFNLANSYAFINNIKECHLMHH